MHRRTEPQQAGQGAGRGQGLGGGVEGLQPGQQLQCFKQGDPTHQRPANPTYHGIYFFINKVLLTHSHTHLLAHCLCCLESRVE